MEFIDNFYKTNLKVGYSVSCWIYVIIMPRLHFSGNINHIEQN